MSREVLRELRPAEGPLSEVMSAREEQEEPRDEPRDIPQVTELSKENESNVFVNLANFSNRKEYVINYFVSGQYSALIPYFLY